MPNEAARPHELDPLTGLYTRDAFCAAAAELIAQKPMGYYVLCNFDHDCRTDEPFACHQAS